MWLEARDMEAGCPLCRYPIFELRIPGYPSRLIAETVANALPTDLDIVATARGRRDVTPETCLGCEGLLCTSGNTPSPLCPGKQDPEDAVRREEACRASLKAVSAKIKEMVDHTIRMQDFLKGTEEEFRGVVAHSDTVGHMKVQAVQLVLKVQNQLVELRTVLLTHKNLFRRLQESREPVVTIVMTEPMKDRLNFLMKKLKNLEQGYLEESRKLCRSTRT